MVLLLSGVSAMNPLILPNAMAEETEPENSTGDELSLTLGCALFLVFLGIAGLLFLINWKYRPFRTNPALRAIAGFGSGILDVGKVFYRAGRRVIAAFSLMTLLLATKILEDYGARESLFATLVWLLLVYIAVHMFVVIPAREKLERERSYLPFVPYNWKPQTFKTTDTLDQDTNGVHHSPYSSPQASLRPSERAISERESEIDPEFDEIIQR